MAARRAVCTLARAEAEEGRIGDMAQNIIDAKLEDALYALLLQHAKYTLITE